MSNERLPEYKMPYEDRVTDEAWAVAKSRKEYTQAGGKWHPWSPHMISIYLADMVAGKDPGVEFTIPSKEDYYWARERVKAQIEADEYAFSRLKKAKTLYCPLPQEEEDIHPEVTSLCTSWNGMRDHLTVAQFFFYAGIPDEALKSVFQYNPHYIFDPLQGLVSQKDGFYVFTQNGKQQLTDLIGKPVAFVYHHNEGRRFASWNLKSKQVFQPSGSITIYAA